LQKAFSVIAALRGSSPVAGGAQLAYQCDLAGSVAYWRSGVMSSLVADLT